jgi:hypothetical protein
MSFWLISIYNLTMLRKGGSGAYYKRLNFSSANELNACHNEVLILHHGLGICSITLIPYVVTCNVVMYGVVRV